MKKKIMGLAVILASTLTIAANCTNAVWAFTPEKVTEIKQIDADEDMVEVTWKDVGAESYKIQYTANKLDWDKAVGCTTSTTNKVSVYNRIPGMTYYVRVKAIYKVIDEEEDDKDGAGGTQEIGETIVDSGSPSEEPQESEKYTLFESEWSDSIDVVTTPKKNIKIIQTGATKTTASFKWDAVVGATHYNIYKKSSGDTKFYKRVTDTNVVVSGLGASKKVDIIVAPVRTNKSGFATECYNVILSSEIKLQPGKVQDISFTSYDSAKKKATLTFAKQEGTKGAEIQLFDCKGKKPIWKGTTTKNTKVIPKIKANRFYRVKVRAYSVIAGKKKYGTWSDYVYVGSQVSVDLKMVFGKIQATWDNYADATDYVVYASDDNCVYKKIKTVKGTKCKISKIGGKAVKSGKNYYVYVVARKKSKNTKYCSMVKNAFFLAAK